jgi:hypothetical protein
MKRFVLMPVMVGLSLSVSAAVYSWKDVNGHTVYSDQPPPPTVNRAQARELNLKVFRPMLKDASGAAAKNSATQGQAAAKQVEAQKAAAARADACQIARYNLSALEGNLVRMRSLAYGNKAQPGPDVGETERMIAKYRKDVQTNCTNS